MASIPVARFYFPLVVSAECIRGHDHAVPHVLKCGTWDSYAAGGGRLFVHFLPKLLKILRSIAHSNLCLLHDRKLDLQWIRKSSSVIVLMAKTKAQGDQH